MRRYAEAEWANSREVRRTELRKAGFWLRLKWRLAYFVVTILDYGLTRRLNFDFE